MIKVVHLITGLANGGSETMLWKLLSRMDSSRFANIVVSMDSRGEVGRRIERLGIPVFALRMNPGVPSLLGLIRLIGLLRAQKPDVLQTWLYHADLLGLVAGKICRVPAIAWNVRCADLDREDHPLHLWLSLRILARTSALPEAVIVNSVAGRLANERLGYKPKRWKLIPNGFELDIFQPSEEARQLIRRELEVTADTLLVGLVARFHFMKDHSTFLRAARRLHKIRPDVHFVLVGRNVDIQNAILMEQISVLNLDEYVHLLGARADIPVVTAALDVASCTSYSEGFPNVIGEAMACGVPCVVTDVGDCAKIIGDAGIVVPPRDCDAIADGWRVLLTMPEEERRMLGMRGRSRIASMFDIDQIIRRYETLYQEILCPMS